MFRAGDAELGCLPPSVPRPAGRDNPLGGGTATGSGQRSTEGRYQGRAEYRDPPPTAHPGAEAARNPWGSENRRHRMLDARVRENQSRLRRGHGAGTRVIARPCAVDAVGLGPAQRPITTARTLCRWTPDDRAGVLSLPAGRPDGLPRGKAWSTRQGCCGFANYSVRSTSTWTTSPGPWVPTATAWSAGT